MKQFRKLPGQSRIEKKQNLLVLFCPYVSSSSCGEAVFQILTSEWGRHPKDLTELRDVLKANVVYYQCTTRYGVLSWLVRKNKIQKWKTDKGYVYALARGRKENGKDSSES